MAPRLAQATVVQVKLLRSAVRQLPMRAAAVAAAFYQEQRGRVVRVAAAPAGHQAPTATAMPER
jgi:hypothetical protein